MRFSNESIKHAGHWALELADVLEADEYVNSEGAASIYQEHEFQARNIDLRFLQSGLLSYNQRRDVFAPGLLIVDVMMWNDKE